MVVCWRRCRSEPKVALLGKPPSYLSAPERSAWWAFVAEAPWLAESDRALVSSACALRAQVQDGDANASIVRELRMHLTAMGCTPTTRQNVHAPEQPDEDDPWAKFEQELSMLWPSGDLPSSTRVGYRIPRIPRGWLGTRDYSTLSEPDSHQAPCIPARNTRVSNAGKGSCKDCNTRIFFGREHGEGGARDSRCQGLVVR